MSDDVLPEPDRAEGAPHPRATRHLMGQGAAEAAFLSAYATGRLHHAWMLTGPRGVGKATLAWRIARFLLTHQETQGDGLFGAPPPPESLDVDPDHPVARRMMALSEPGLFLLRRGGLGTSEREREKASAEGRFSSDIRVHDVRELGKFIHFSAADGGRRVVIVDAADALNTQAANALLKMLEEPPARTVMLLVAHQPSGLLPTIRSRCRMLRLGPLGPGDMARALDQAGIAPDADPAVLAELSAGSVGAAVRLVTLDGAALYAEISALMEGLPRPDRARAIRLAESVAQRGAEARRDLLFTLIELFLARLARTGATGAAPAVEATPGEAALMTRLAPDPGRARLWAQVAEETGARARHGLAVNLDAVSLVLDTVLRIQQTAGG